VENSVLLFQECHNVTAWHSRGVEASQKCCVCAIFFFIMEMNAENCMNRVTLKTKPEDFFVAESAVLPYSYSDSDRRYYYYILEKSEYTTLCYVTMMMPQVINKLCFDSNAVYGCA